MIKKNEGNKWKGLHGMAHTSGDEKNKEREKKRQAAKTCQQTHKDKGKEFVTENKEHAVSE